MQRTSQFTSTDPNQLMARKPELSQETIEKLGLERLSRLVLEAAARDTGFRKLLKAALAGLKGPQAVAAIVDRRLGALAKARSFIDWHKARAFRDDLSAMLAIIMGELTEASPTLAADRLVSFVLTHSDVFERCDDSSGAIQDVYHTAVEGLGDLAARMPPADRPALVLRITGHLGVDEWACLRRMALGLVPHLDAAALNTWDTVLSAEVSKRQLSAPRTTKASPVRQERTGAESFIIIRQAIADARGDVDGFIALNMQLPAYMRDSIGTARRLLGAARLDEALQAVRSAKGASSNDSAPQRFTELLDSDIDGFDLDNVGEAGATRLEAEILDALGRSDEAQALRWASFARRLDVKMLRDYLAHLPDFDEFDALDRAFAHVRAMADHHAALAFLITWPKLDLAASHVLAHASAWEGRHYGLLSRAADALEADHPLAATILLRSLLTDILNQGRSSAYGHAARYLKTLDRLASEIPMHDGTAAAEAGAHVVQIADHATWRASLIRQHGRKQGFWVLVEDKH
jgi:hypothetical protein